VVAMVVFMGFLVFVPVVAMVVFMGFLVFVPVVAMVVVVMGVKGSACSKGMTNQTFAVA